MKITVCELTNNPDHLEGDWDALVSHVASEQSELVLLPEMPFFPWMARTRHADEVHWRAAVEVHEHWIGRIEELAPAAVAGTRPVIDEGRRFNEGFVWEPRKGCRGVHRKVYLPEEESFWEATWYERGPKEFQVVECAGARLGFLICTELWFGEHAREYGRQGAHLLLSPRATPMETLDKWIAGGRTAAVVSGAYCLSSNFRGGEEGLEWAGGGWVVEPEHGELVGLTSQEHPFVSFEIDLEAAEMAKRSYPRYVRSET